MEFIEFLKKDIQKLSTKDVMEILKRQPLNLDDNDLEILQKSKISGSSLFLFKHEHFYNEGLAIGPTLAILDFLKKLETGS